VLLTARKENCMIVVILMLLLADCASPSQPLPSVESRRLSTTDIEILRAGVSSLIQARIGESPMRINVLKDTTLIRLFWTVPPVPSPTVPPPPPPLFDGWRLWPQSRPPPPPPPPPSVALDVALLSTEERVAWEARSRVTREIPDLAIAGLENRHNASDVPDDWTVMAVTAPAYPTNETAVLYAQFVCGGLCGEGRLIRLRRDASSWRITASQMLWIR
jgi:hypothetical protein